MQTYGAFHAKTHFSELLEQVEKGEQIIITKHGHPVARLVPTGNPDKEQIRIAIQQLKKFSQPHTLGPLDWKTLRDKGRK